MIRMVVSLKVQLDFSFCFLGLSFYIEEIKFGFVEL